MRTRRMLWLGGAALVTASVACSSLKVETDADPQVNLATYKRFAFARGANGEQVSAPHMDDLMRKRVEDSIAGELRKKGLQLDTSATGPDIIVAYHTGRQEKIDYVNTGYSYGRWGAVYGGGTTVNQYTEGSLIVDLIDSKRKELVWRGTATDAVNDREEAQKKIPQAVAKMFEKFPASA